MKKKLLIIIGSLILLLLLLFTYNSDLRRKILTYVFVTYDYYQEKILIKDVQQRNFSNASKKLIKYINTSNKLTLNNGFMVNGIYDSIELVMSRALIQKDYNYMENVLIKFLEMEPNSYNGNVWLAKAYADNKPEVSIQLLEKAIAISPSEEDAYREILRISQIYKWKDINNKYCNLYSNTQLGGKRNSHYSNLFNSNNLRRFAIKINDDSANTLFYTNDSLLINEFNDYEFVLQRKTNIDHLNFYFSFLPGVKLEIKEIKIYSSDNTFIIPINEMLVSSNKGYFDNEFPDNDNISMYFLSYTDTFIKIYFNDEFFIKNKTKFANIEKLNIKMNLSRLDLANKKFCEQIK